MGINIVDKINTLKHDELKKIKTELEPHFKKGVTFEILGDKLKVCDEGICYTILKIKTNGEIDNDFDSYYRSEGMRINDIFEEVGENLTEIKVKPVKEFDVYEWKREFAKKHDLIFNAYGAVKYRGEIIINIFSDVNMKEWHNNIFEDCHKIFKFNANDIVVINSQELADEFERVFVIMKDYLDKVEKEKPDLNKGDNNDK